MTDFSKLSITEIIQEFDNACMNGDLDTIKDFVLHEHKEHFKHSVLTQGLGLACISGHLHIAKYLLTSPDIKKKIIINEDSPNGNAFHLACNSRNIELVKYLLTSPDIEIPPNINSHNGMALREAARNGDLNMVKFLTASPDLSTHADIFKKDEFHMDSFLIACQAGNMHIVDYLLHSPQLSVHSDIHIKDDWGFINVCKCLNFEFIEYFLYDLNFPVSEKLKDKLMAEMEDYPEDLDLILNMIDKRDLFFKINDALSENDSPKISKKKNMKNYFDMSIKDTADDFESACRRNDLETVAYILNSDIISARVDKNESFIIACYNGHLDVVKLFLDPNQFFDIHHRDDKAIKSSINSGNVELVRYLLNTPHFNSPEKFDHIAGLCTSCILGKIPMVEFFLTSYDYEQQIKDVAFCYSVKSDKKEVINYFLYDLNIQMSDKIKKELLYEFITDERALDERLISTSSLMEKRDLFLKINNELTNNPIEKIKNKI